MRLFRLTRRRGEELLPCAAAAALLAALFLWGPPAARFPDELSTAVYDRRGELLGAAVSPGGFWRFPAGGRPPEKYVAALVAYEDKRFFSHPGVDPSAIVRALRQNARAGRIVSGGSTISMQAARLARPGSPRTLPEKAAEAWLALRLEFLRGKRGVLALYAENKPVGFVMYALDEDDHEYWIYRLMIDKRYQRRGYGREAMRMLIERIQADEEHRVIYISFEPENIAAKALYESLGFVPDGRIEYGEVVYKLEKPEK